MPAAAITYTSIAFFPIHSNGGNKYIKFQTSTYKESPFLKIFISVKGILYLKEKSLAILMTRLTLKFKSKTILP